MNKRGLFLKTFIPLIMILSVAVSLAQPVTVAFADDSGGTSPAPAAGSSTGDSGGGSSDTSGGGSGNTSADTGGAPADSGSGSTGGSDNSSTPSGGNTDSGSAATDTNNSQPGGNTGSGSVTTDSNNSQPGGNTGSGSVTTDYNNSQPGVTTENESTAPADAGQNQEPGEVKSQSDQVDTPPEGQISPEPDTLAVTEDTPEITASSQADVDPQMLVDPPASSGTGSGASASSGDESSNDGGNGTSVPAAVEEPVSNVIQALVETDSVIMDGSGNTVPLASQAAEDVIANGDPYIKRGGVTYYFLPTGGCGALSNCAESATPFQDAVYFANPGETINILAGNYDETVKIDRVVTLKGISGDVSVTAFDLYSDLSLSGTAVFAPNVFVNPGANLQDAVNLVQEGGTVQVNAGTYAGNVLINKSVTIQGDPGHLDEIGPGVNAPVIDGGGNNGSGFIIHKGTSNVTISGFEIRNFDTRLLLLQQGQGIAVDNYSRLTNDTSNVTISNNYIHDVARAGIGAFAGALGNNTSVTGWTIKNNIISNSGLGNVVLVNPNDTTIDHNVFVSGSGSTLTGVALLSLGQEQSNNDVTNNTFYGENTLGSVLVGAFSPDSVITGDGLSAALTGDDDASSNSNLSNININTNLFLTPQDLGNILIFQSEGGSINNVNANLNSFPDTQGLVTLTNDPINGDLNWWGSNAGNPGDPNVNNWLKFGVLSASPPQINVGGSSTLSAALYANDNPSQHYAPWWFNPYIAQVGGFGVGTFSNNTFTGTNNGTATFQAWFSEPSPQGFSQGGEDIPYDSEDAEPVTTTVSVVDGGTGGGGPTGPTGDDPGGPTSDTPPLSGRPGFIPVTGSNPVALDCQARTTLYLSPITQTTFNKVLCGYKALLTQEFTSSLPSTLPDGSTFVEGMTLTVFNGNEPTNLPAGVSVDVEFFLPKNIDANAPIHVYFWDPALNGGLGGWVLVNDVSVEGGVVSFTTSHTGTFVVTQG